MASWAGGVDPTYESTEVDEFYELHTEECSRLRAHYSKAIIFYSGSSDFLWVNRMGRRRGSLSVKELTRFRFHRVLKHDDLKMVIIHLRSKKTCLGRRVPFFVAKSTVRDEGLLFCEFNLEGVNSFSWKFA